jgi:hypothetical protein
VKKGGNSLLPALASLLQFSKLLVDEFKLYQADVVRFTYEIIKKKMHNVSMHSFWIPNAKIAKGKGRGRQ